MSEVSCEFYDLPCHFGVFTDWLDLKLNWIWEQLYAAWSSVLSSIPVPGWLVDPTFQLPDGVLWFASAFELPYGFSIFISALILRFSIRRIPFIG